MSVTNVPLEMAGEAVVAGGTGLADALAGNWARTRRAADITPRHQQLRQAGQARHRGKAVRMSVPGLIWLALMPYLASSCGVATYTVPVKLPCRCAATWAKVTLASCSGSTG